jgi:glucose uptake protein
VYSVIAGCLMGFFYPQLAQTLSPAFSTGPIVPGYLTPYTVLVLFGAGLAGHSGRGHLGSPHLT